MKKLEIGAERELIPLADAEEFSPEIYRETGFFVVRNVIPAATVAAWQEAWRAFYEESRMKDRKVNPFNPVHVHEAAPDVLANVFRTPEILDTLERLYPDLALFMQRFVIKDANSRGNVFVHGDFAYDYGWPEKTTTFIPLSVSNKMNGGISFYPGTHHFGYMGDAGEANTALLSDDWPKLTPTLNPGDIALCHTCTWHYSPPFRAGSDRILIQATYQPSNDPSSTQFLRGENRVRYALSRLPRDQFFVRSRSSRLRELQDQVDRLSVLDTAVG
ncbi:MAG: phytanoyl-CoA dioxygenase family protein [Silicimonas sp.]|nr:phytanoyl-CoA dioxygenase family protein [Silicimonas sp.]